MSESRALRTLEKENDKLQERIKELEAALKEWRDKADSELDINAGLHTENAHLQKRIKELEG